ncbi:MAG: peroxiredoxin family protein [Pseudomonadota bacterium]
MKTFLIAAGVALLLLIATVFVMREPLKQAAYDGITEGMFMEADEDDFDVGPALGSRFPGVTALYQGQQIALIEPFAGPRGTLFMASRSFDWCPYCMKQMIQLNEAAAQFRAAGIGLVAMTYDTPEQLAAFGEKHDITIPMLSDVDALTFKTLGILNADYPPGDEDYGLPYPGSLIIAPDGTIVGKVFLEAYSSRVSASAVLALAEASLSESSADSGSESSE